MPVLLGGFIAYFVGRGTLGLIGIAVFGLDFHADSAMMALSAFVPMLTSGLGLLFAKRALDAGVTANLR